MKNVICLLLGFAVISCSTKENVSQGSQSLAADVFDKGGSDPAAIELADSVIQSLGGLEKWNQINAVSWTSSGRKFYWDPGNRLGRMENEDTIALINTITGGMSIEIAGQGNAQVAMWQAIWDKEFYNFLIPYELKRSGATLAYMGDDSLAGQRYNSLVLTFQNKPDKYKLYIDKRTKMIRYSAYYPLTSNMKEDDLSSWDNYQQVGAMRFSFNRTSGGPKEVTIEDSLPENFFTTF